MLINAHCNFSIMFKVKTFPTFLNLIFDYSSIDEWTKYIRVWPSRLNNLTVIMNPFRKCHLYLIENNENKQTKRFVKTKLWSENNLTEFPTTNSPLRTTFSCDLAGTYNSIFMAAGRLVWPYASALPQINVVETLKWMS